MSWHEEYLTALQRRNDVELRSKVVYDQYSRLANRVAGLEANAQHLASSGPREAQASVSPSRNDSAKGQGRLPPPNVDLAEAQKARAQLEARLKEIQQELDTLSATSGTEKQRIRELTADNTTFTTKLRDRDEELREKSKLLDNVHDEMLALTMQLNVTEEHNQKLKKENQDLVDRWMARVGQEADAMNNASKFS